MILVVGALMACLLPQAVWAQQEWQSTSTMQGSGSVYSSQVTTVGAASVGNMATTTYSPSNASSGPRRVIGTNQEVGVTNDPNSPLGDALIPLMLCACAYLIIRARKRANKGERANG